MARTRRPLWKVEQFKNKIFEAALELFNGSGYNEVSIRKIAKKAGCSPATIYNYYPHKDALYLDILKKGFEILHELLVAVPAEHNPMEKLSEYASILYRFSLDYPYYYDIMFSFPVPKYQDYLATDMEKEAWEEKSVALQNYYLLENTLKAALEEGLINGENDIKRLVKSLFAICHGIISLNRSRIWDELNTDPEELYHDTVMDLLHKLKSDARQYNQ